MTQLKIKAISKKKLQNNLRWHALVLLDKVENKAEYSNIVIGNFIKETEFDERDRRLIVQIVYGVIQNRYSLDFYMENIIKGKKIDKWILSLLRMSLYQMLYLDRIPEYAVVNEAVLIAKTNGHRQLGNFVNALLRKFMREDKRQFSEIETINERLGIQYSIDLWIVDYLLKYLEPERVETLLKSVQEEAYISARINPAITNRKEVIDELESEGYSVSESKLSQDGIRSLEGNLVDSKAFHEGRITIQDESSMLVARIGQIQGDENILDACSAPGGKATHIAGLLKTGHLTALDISEYKLKLVEDHLERMGLSKLATLIAINANEFKPTEGQLYDIIFLDAPCSGLGLIRRKPEIKYQKSIEDVHNLVDIQKELITNMAKLLKVGGKLIYSTCTITYEENEDLVDWFLSHHPEFDRDSISTEENIAEDIITDRGEVRIFPHQYHTDGFFISRMIKSRN